MKNTTKKSKRALVKATKRKNRSKKDVTVKIVLSSEEKYLAQFPKPEWAVSQCIRSSGLVEDVCEHGVGHPNTTWLRIYDPNGKRYLSIHGCDGCCSGEYPLKSTKISLWNQVKAWVRSMQD